MEAFLNSMNIPKHIQRLLELAGVTCVADIVDINEEFLREVEQQVRTGSFQFQVDLTSKENRLKYFGVDYSQLDQFSFRLMERTKLLKLSEAARKKLDADDMSRK